MVSPILFHALASDGALRDIETKDCPANEMWPGALAEQATCKLCWRRTGTQVALARGAERRCSENSRIKGVRIGVPPMKIKLESFKRSSTSAFATSLVAALTVAVFSTFSAAGAVTNVHPKSTTSTTVKSRTQSISDGPSRGECIKPDVVGTSSLGLLQSLVSSFDALTGTKVTCLSAYLDTAQTWSDWERPWVTSPVDGYSSWVAQNPHVRQLVLAVNLIPGDLQNIQNPASWERACVAGQYDGYARELGKSLVAAGLQNSVIRLGAEMNGNWEPDFIGPGVAEQKLWARCFDNEVTSLRRAKGEHFLIDWNPNACTGNYPFSNYYPGNAYVNIIGIDLYDVGCLTPTTPLTFAQLAHEPFGLASFESFAQSKKKPMSIPEWGLEQSPSGDDPGYVSGIGKDFDTKDFAFETYFDVDNPGSGILPLASDTPLSLVAFRQWFSTT
jgi:Glycosyl hydrolase family 26